MRHDDLDNLMELLDDEVKKAVLSLPDDFRDAVVMADMRDMSYKEIADLMGCPLGTVMSRLSRARERLRRLTDQDEQPVPRRVK